MKFSFHAGWNMKRIALATSLLLTFSASHGRASELKHPSPVLKRSTVSQDKRDYSIHVANGDWGDAKPEEIEILLNEITAEMLTHFPNRRIASIEVSSSSLRPVVLYEKGPENQYRILLAAKGRNWGEYIYEFSHELFHVLANYENHRSPQGARHQWFEEMMCETVSLYNLKRLSTGWKEAAPRGEWVSSGPELARFTQRALSDSHRQLPPNTSLPQWFQQNRSSLLGNPYLRNKNEIVAMLFLPILEQNRDWRAVSFLNLQRTQEAKSFREYLEGWYGDTPTAHRDLIVRTMKLFKFHVPAATTLRPIMPQVQKGKPVVHVASVDRAVSTNDAGAEGPIHQ
ncbi:MAG: hypothetical protein JWR21_843 [Herminiimonas sp.]|nr:hypothetical protein [Herminiimonas sp.]MDB5852409.1 hypothetical protein [Herminiimonas sp.]